MQSKAFAINRLKKSRLNIATKQLLNALLLGEKTALDREAIEAFSQAGLAHLLAISGLHIGLLMLLFRVLWSPVRFLKNGELFQSVGVVLSLWLYAFFVGGTPSVLRALLYLPQTDRLFTSTKTTYRLFGITLYGSVGVFLSTSPTSPWLSAKLSRCLWNFVYSSHFPA